MITIEVDKQIDSAGWGWLFSLDDGESYEFSVENLKKVFLENPKENEFTLNINCPGGSVREGFIIYDYLRTSGKKIHTNIVGGCHSMAVVLLLAAPKGNRTANPMATALFHDVRGGMDGTAEDLAAAAEDMRAAREKILTVYEDRTGKNRDDLRQFMLEEKERTVEELIQWGFVDRINKYNTNLIDNGKMKTTQKLDTTKKGVIKNWLAKLSNLLEINNFTFTSEDGTELFTTEKEDDTLDVGDAASPDGTFTLPDGRTVTISDGVITTITEDPGEENELYEENEALKAENEVLKAEKKELSDLLLESKNIILGTTKSTYKPANRRVMPGNKQGTEGRREIQAEDVEAVLDNVEKKRKGGING